MQDLKEIPRLFDQRGSIYSTARIPTSPTSSFVQIEIHLLLLKYGSGVAKTAQDHEFLLNVNVVDNLLPIQDAEATQTMFDLIQDPQGYYDHIRRYSTAVILASMCGQRGARFNFP